MHMSLESVSDVSLKSESSVELAEGFEPPTG